MRAATAALEPGYASAMRLRNRLYDRGLLRSYPLGRPAISVGNLTAGGTGKTPVVRWLASAMRRRGHSPAILTRGYMRGSNIQSDEATMLHQQLNPPDLQPIAIEANPDRVAAAAAVLNRSPTTNLFILDDAFQHRRAQRDFDLVLIDATRPFGFNHVHPRGLLREPLSGLRRADALLITRADMATPDELQALTDKLRKWNADVPIFVSSHCHAGLLDDDGKPLPLELLGENPFFAFTGIARPDALDRQLQQWGKHYCGHRWFGDHHSYTEADLRSIIAEAQSRGATALVTTSKDAVKLQPWRTLYNDSRLPLWRLDLAVRFQGNDEERLLKQISDAMVSPKHQSEGHP
jgi:tetraacyldisaccharide 4'-kinase